jgi:ribonuclease-3
MIDHNQLQTILDYQFKDINLLKKALRHRSYLNENRRVTESNERLEFLGDAVLEIVTSEFLYHTYINLPEGKLTNLRSKIVQTKTLAAVANKLNLGQYILLSRGEAASGGRTNESLLADLVEAIIGAIYIDSGIKQAEKFVRKYILDYHEELIAQSQVQDWKSKLQEYVQSHGGIAPIYEIVKEEGPDHNRTFTTQVHFFDQPQSIGTGKSKQSAQQKAAYEAYRTLTK